MPYCIPTWHILSYFLHGRHILSYCIYTTGIYCHIVSNPWLAYIVIFFLYGWHMWDAPSQAAGAYGSAKEVRYCNALWRCLRKTPKCLHGRDICLPFFSNYAAKPEICLHLLGFSRHLWLLKWQHLMQRGFSTSDDLPLKTSQGDQLLTGPILRHWQMCRGQDLVKELGEEDKSIVDHPGKSGCRKDH